MTLRTLAIFSLALAGTQAISVFPRVDPQCQDSGVFAGIGASVCAGSDGKKHSDVLACPLQPGAVGIICPQLLKTGQTNPCTSINVPAGEHKCYTDNSVLDDREKPIQECTCINGNFCCSQNAEVAGGQSAVKYFKEVGCNCDG